MTIAPTLVQVAKIPNSGQLFLYGHHFAGQVIKVHIISQRKTEDQKKAVKLISEYFGPGNK